jgi:RIO-like serine/threonine protein kinase
VPATQTLKRDLFGEVRLETPADGAQIVVRDLRAARRWTRWLARFLARREARALRHLDGTRGIPRLLAASRDEIRREYLAGLPMQLARPSDPGYFRSASQLLRRLHRCGIAHNDLAKEPNWLVRPDGSPALVDFQLASLSRRRSRWFRALAHDDLRHFLKHKRTYLPDLLTARERRILARRAWPSRVWMATGKPVYRFITRRLLSWRDREGAGDRQLR